MFVIAYLVLEDRTVIEGTLFGYENTVFGELVFNTGMTGYQEILTDPSYAGQVVTMTYPLIGNYGINSEDIESDRPKVSGFIVKELCYKPSHWQSDEDLNAYLVKNKITGLTGIDTRMLTKKIREKGAMKCAITNQLVDEELFMAIDQYIFPKDIVAQVSLSEVVNYEGKGKKIGIIDLGLKKGIVKQLLNLSCDVTCFPHDVALETIQKQAFDAILFSNGPGDPKEAKNAIELAKALIGKIPVFGICLGHQVLALALGADTYKLKFGHRGANHPVIEIDTNKVYMSSQNHGYAVDKSSIKDDIVITHLNVNDETIEGIASKSYFAKSVQFHPEEGPGPEDAHVIFENWINSL